MFKKLKNRTLKNKIKTGKHFTNKLRIRKYSGNANENVLRVLPLGEIYRFAPRSYAFPTNVTFRAQEAAVQTALERKHALGRLLDIIVFWNYFFYGIGAETWLISTVRFFS